MNLERGSGVPNENARASIGDFGKVENAESPLVQRVQRRVEELFDIARPSGGGASRLAYSPEEAQAMRLVAGWMEEAGLEVGKDEHGNLWGMPPAEQGAVATSGSHVDAVPDGGRFDGALGTVLALECVRTLSGPYGVLVCAAEEAPRFGAGTLGSRSLVGKIGEKELHALRDAHGISAAEARRRFLEALADVATVDGREMLCRVAGHVEVHVEQRRELTDAGVALGIATALAGPARYRLRFVGTTGHSGETPPAVRHDALCAASETVLLAEKLSRTVCSTVLTASTVHVSPNSLTAIPGMVELGLDVRSTELVERDNVLSRLFRDVAEAAESRGVEFVPRPLSAAEPTVLHQGLVRAAERACRKLGIQSKRCTSMASHDVGHLSSRVPAALLFVPSTNGVSHSPSEEVDWRDVESTAQVLRELLEQLVTKGGDR